LDKKMQVSYGDYTAYMDGYLQNNLELYKKMVKKKFDLFFVVTGREGVGKSVLCATILKYLDNSFNMDRCFMNGDDFIRALIEADGEKDKFKAFMFDEGQEFTSRSAVTKFNKLLVQVISKIRAKQLYIGICIPNFFELDKYGAIHRSNFLIQVYQDKRGKRGGFRFWNWERKKNLYLLGKKNYDYFCVPPNFRGFFTYSAFPFPQEEYDKLKFDAMQDILKQLEDLKGIMQRDTLIQYLYKECGLTPAEIMEIFEKKGVPAISEDRIGRIARRRD